MPQKRIGCLVVQEKGLDSESHPIVGLVSESDLVRKVMAADSVDSSVSVGKLMGDVLHIIPANRSMLEASHFMGKSGVRHLCVSEGEEIVGLISIRDLVRYFVYGESGPI